MIRSNVLKLRDITAARLCQHLTNVVLKSGIQLLTCVWIMLIKRGKWKLLATLSIIFTCLRLHIPVSGAFFAFYSHGVLPFPAAHG